MVHEENSPTNSIKERATGAIAISPNPSLHGPYKCMLLRSGAIVNRRSFTKLPITLDVIERVEELAGDNDQHFILRYGNNIFFDRRPTNDS